MYRVMPWAYPTIPGQSSGGASVDPTPEPTPEPQYYDFSGMSIKFPEKTGYLSAGGVSGNLYNPAIGFFPKITGVNVIDNSLVSSVRVEVIENTLTVTPTSADGKTYDPSLDYLDPYISNKKIDGTSFSIYFKYTPKVSPGFNGTTKITMSGNLKVKLKAYDSSGNLLQESQEITVE